MSFEVRLINTIKRNPILYDKSMKEYKNGSSREYIWKKVTHELGRKDVEGVKKRWRTLRDSFIKYHHIVKAFKSGARREKKKKWIFYDEMLFLTPHIERRKSEKKFDNTEEKKGTEHAGCENFEQKDNVQNNSNEIPQYNKEPQNLDYFFKPTSFLIKETQTKRQFMDEQQADENNKPYDADEQFLLSLLPIMKRLPQRKNLKARIKIQTLLYGIEFDEIDEYSSSCSSNIIQPRSMDDFDVQETKEFIVEENQLQDIIC